MVEIDILLCSLGYIAWVKLSAATHLRLIRQVLQDLRVLDLLLLCLLVLLVTRCVPLHGLLHNLDSSAPFPVPATNEVKAV